MNNYCIIGSGRQGTAAAYDIIKFGNPESLTIIDSSSKNLDKCDSKIKKLTDYQVNKIQIDMRM